jgi:hypothetical protein
VYGVKPIPLVICSFSALSVLSYSFFSCLFAKYCMKSVVNPQQDKRGSHSLFFVSYYILETLTTPFPSLTHLPSHLKIRTAGGEEVLGLFFDKEK